MFSRKNGEFRVPAFEPSVEAMIQVLKLHLFGLFVFFAQFVG
jgi:hypothetical protein